MTVSVTTVVVALLALGVGLALGVLLGERWGGRLPLAGQSTPDLLVAPVEAGLQELAERLERLQHDGVRFEARLSEQVEGMRRGNERLTSETAALVEALRRPQVRGRWGELQLRRSLELAGLTRHCAFEEQVAHAGGPDGPGSRPDVVVTLPGNRCVVIDAKVPLDAFLSAQQARSEDEREGHLRRHASQLRRHVEQLASKQYWRQFEQAPSFVVLFVPGEALFAQALDTDPGLLDDAAAKRVMIATPTTLIAMLRTIDASWSQQSVAANAQAIHAAATEVYDRLCVAGRHLDRVGRSLTGAVRSYNELVGSLETRVLVSARRLHDLDTGQDELPLVEPISDAVRPLTAPELTVDADVGLEVVSGAPGRETWTGPDERRGNAADAVPSPSLKAPERAGRRP